MLRDRDVLIEFYRMGGYVKVSALDPESYTELCRVGDPGAGEDLVSRTAVQKCYVKTSFVRPPWMGGQSTGTP